MEQIRELAHRQHATFETSQPPSNLSTTSGFVQRTPTPRESHLPPLEHYAGDPGTCPGVPFPLIPNFRTPALFFPIGPIEDSVFNHANARKGALLGNGCVGAAICCVP